MSDSTSATSTRLDTSEPVVVEPRRIEPGTEPLEIADRLERIAAAESVDAREIARLTAISLASVARRIAAIERRTTLISGRIGGWEARLEESEEHIGEHQKSLRLICELLKRMDDPYGFGRETDDRIASEEIDYDRLEPEG
jgi:hypothetical protein